MPFNIREADISRTAGAFHGAAFSLVAQRQISLKKALALCKCFFLAPPVGLEPTTLRLTAACSTNRAIEEYESGPAWPTRPLCLCWRYLSSRPVSRQVFSAQVSLTAVFGMGTGGPSPQSAPTYFSLKRKVSKRNFRELSSPYCSSQQ